MASSTKKHIPRVARDTFKTCIERRIGKSGVEITLFDPTSASVGRLPNSRNLRDGGRTVIVSIKRIRRDPVDTNILSIEIVSVIQPVSTWKIKASPRLTCLVGGGEIVTVVCVFPVTFESFT